MSASEAPSLTVIVPVRDGGAAFGSCLEAIGRSEYRSFELVVVDDGSSDGSSDLARRHGATVLATAGHEGPAAARNLGAAAATGETLLFVDADCEVHRDTVGLVAEALSADGLVAVFGSYDDQPASKRTVSRFRNLLHHYVHQTSAPRVETFWAGCGGVERRAFLEVGGFDAGAYPRPSIEDIDLGYRLSDAGGRIELRRDIQVRHHKRWTLGSMIATDLRHRGVPWTRLLLRRRSTSRDLNLSSRGRLGVALASVCLLSLAAAIVWPPTLVACLVAAVAIVIVHRDLYRLLRRCGGVGFAAASLPLHLLHLATSALAFGVGLAAHLLAAMAPSRR